MMMMMPLRPTYRLVVTDLDGTVVHKDLTVTLATRAVFWYLSKHTHIQAAIATGRMYPSAKPYAHLLHMEAPLICYQGGLIRQIQAPEAVLYSNPIPITVATELIRYAQANDLHMNMYINDVLYTPPHPVYVEEYRATSSITPSVVDNLLEYLTDAPPKLVMIDNDPERHQAMRAYLQTTYGTEKLMWCQSRHNFLEITHPATSKWSAVCQLAEQLQIPLNQVVCLGDEENDLSMIVGAKASGGLGIAMGQGPSLVQAQASLVTKNISEDGAAHAIATHVLGLPLETIVERYQQEVASTEVHTASALSPTGA
jgi:Cof subfamily protein (haloacid dehalogenase superfamily)